MIIQAFIQFWITAGFFSMVIFSLYHDKTDQIDKVEQSFPGYSRAWIWKMLTIMHLLLVPLTLWLWPRFMYQLYKQ